MKMDLQTRKLNIIQEFLRVGNEELVDKIEKLLKAEKKNKLERSMSPMSEEEFNSIIDKSEEDFVNNRVIAAKDLKKEASSWK